MEIVTPVPVGPPPSSTSVIPLPSVFTIPFRHWPGFSGAHALSCSTQMVTLPSNPDVLEFPTIHLHFFSFYPTAIFFILIRHIKCFGHFMEDSPLTGPIGLGA